MPGCFKEDFILQCQHIWDICKLAIEQVVLIFPHRDMTKDSLKLKNCSC